MFYRWIRVFNLLAILLIRSLDSVHAQITPIELPWSYEQLYITHGMPFHNDSTRIQFVPAPKQEHHVWSSDEKYELTLSCWVALQWLSKPKAEDAHMKPYNRRWYVGQGTMDEMRPVSLFGYRIEKATSSLLLNISKIRENKHRVFTCVLSSSWPFVSGLAETHEIVFYPPKHLKGQKVESTRCQKKQVTVSHIVGNQSDSVLPADKDVYGRLITHEAVQGWCLPAGNYVRMREFRENQRSVRNKTHGIEWNQELFRSPADLETIMDHLRPEDRTLFAQLEAIRLVLDLTYLTFADSEITLMLFVSTGLALYGFCLTTLLFFSMNPEMTWQMEAEFIAPPSRLQHLLLPPFVKFVKLIEACLFLPFNLYEEAKRSKRHGRGLLRRMRDSRLSVLTEHVIRETLNIYRQQMMWQRLEDLRRMQRLGDLLTELTVNRIVEAAELALLMQSDPEMEPDFVSFDVNIRFKRKTPLVIRPYLRFPRHYIPESFLMHPPFWIRLHQFHSIYRAPDYPLEF
ncbi:hypothetical protein FGIG_05337 [Fasciola gigantica]|uniref:Ig-like domain-containing protein n=1 Tax=Fasciola gigantica TaxID=46835 RepID=A0A504YV42_FASGI|nr:hypothetical protein FGIG_05337 [Fasciola gigantica]